jgi:preprotein translocase subunit SecF
MSLIKLSKVLLVISALAVLASIGLLIFPGPKLSMEFTGGTLMNITLPQGKTKEDVRTALTDFTLTDGRELGNVALSTTQKGNLLMRMPTLGNEDHLALLSHLTAKVGAVTEQQFTTIGPTVGQTLKRRSVEALIVASVGIVLYIALAFRKVPHKLSPWRFGILAVVAMVHDMLITSGVFVVLGVYTNFEMDTLFVSALLTTLGYSVNDTIVIFDRIRENVAFADKHEDFASTTERSLRQSLSRTLNTGLGALIMLFCLFFLGSESIRWFMLALIIGTIIGTYSSFFVAAPLLVFLRKKE